MGRIIRTSSTNTRHKHKQKTSEHTHTHTHHQQQQQQQHFIKYKHTMKFTGLIASTLMLLLAVMASTASARSIAFPEPQYCCNAYNAKCESCKQGLSEEEFCRIYPTFSGCPTPTPVCCNAYNAECEACKFGITVDELCRRDPHSHVCPQKPTKPSHPDNCYSTIWNTE